MKKVHLIYAHPKENSLNAALRDQAIETLQSNGHTVVVSDLYQLLADGNKSVVYFSGQSLSKDDEKDIHAEQQKIKDSELTLLQFPLYWFGFPAILKNYFDQVYAAGFAYPGKFENSPLHDGRKVMFSITTQSTAEDFTQTGCNGDIEKTLYPLELAFRFVGYDILPHCLAFGVHDLSPEKLGDIFQRFKSQLGRFSNPSA